MEEKETGITINMDTSWTRSMVEEVIACLWIIAAILCFGFDFLAMGWACTIKALFDTCLSLFFGFRESLRELKEKREKEAK